MAKLRIKFVINKGRRGAPLGKLGRISEQAEKFLRALSSDCGVEAKTGEWLAAEFENGSVQFNAEFQGAVDGATAQIFERNMEVLADFDPERDGLNGIVNQTTALEYAKIGSLIDPDEEIGVGILSHRGGAPKWRSITYSKSQSLKSKVESPVLGYGSVQGLIHSWVKGAHQPYLQVRELSTNRLVKIVYTQQQYSSIAEIMKDKNTVVLISGSCTYDKQVKGISSMRLETIEATRALSPEDFERLFGSFPGYETQDYSDYEM